MGEKMLKFHRDAKPLPTDPIERRERVRWLTDHRLWHYPVVRRVPPPGREEELALAPDERDESGWIETTYLLGGFYDCVEFEVAYVDPLTETIEDDDRRNTAFRVWIEAGGWTDCSTREHEPVPDGGWNDYNKWGRCHDFDLDCGAPDMETAILELASLVEFHYGDGHEGLPTAPRRCELRRVEGVSGDAPGREQYASTCVAAEDRYCVACGYCVKE